MILLIGIRSCGVYPSLPRTFGEGELLMSHPVPTRDGDMHKGPLSYI
jgi:hypothetical protein